MITRRCSFLLLVSVIAGCATGTMSDVIKTRTKPDRRSIR